METNTNHSPNAAAQTAEKMLFDSNKEIMDFYTKQVNAINGFYKNTLKTFGNGEKVWSTYPEMPNDFFNYDITKALSWPFVGMAQNYANPYSSYYDLFTKQILELNTAIYNQLSKSIQQRVNFFEISTKYQDLLNIRMASFNNILKYSAEAFNKQFETSNEVNNKATENIQQQFKSMITQTQKFWLDVFSFGQNEKPNLENPIKDILVSEIKKRSVVPMHELLDHKI